MVAHAGLGRRRPPTASAAEAICEQVRERCGIDVAQLRCDAVLQRTDSPTQEASAGRPEDLVAVSTAARDDEDGERNRAEPDYQG